MSKIKVIKKNGLIEPNLPLETIEEDSQPKSNRRQAIETVESWITDWRRQTEIKTLLALDDLIRFKLQDSNGM